MSSFPGIICNTIMLHLRPYNTGSGNLDIPRLLRKVTALSLTLARLQGWHFPAAWLCRLQDCT